MGALHRIVGAASRQAAGLVPSCGIVGHRSPALYTPSFGQTRFDGNATSIKSVVHMEFRSVVRRLVRHRAAVADRLCDVACQK